MKMSVALDIRSRPSWYERLNFPDQAQNATLSRSIDKIFRSQTARRARSHEVPRLRSVGSFPGRLVGSYSAIRERALTPAILGFCLRRGDAASTFGSNLDGNGVDLGRHPVDKHCLS